MFHMPDSSTHNAAHSEENSIAADTQGKSHDVHIIVHASAHDVLNPLEILAKQEAVKTCNQTGLGVD